MKKIQIAVAYHKDSQIIKNDCLLPVHVGKSCTDVELDMPGDNTGDNISCKNFGYAELTAIYWLWKNSDADIKGLFHYRRFLDLNPYSEHSNQDIYEYSLDCDFSSEKFLKELDISKKCINDLMSEYSIITRKKEDLKDWSNYTVRSHYEAEHHIEHLDRALDIIKSDYPGYYQTAINLINGSQSYFTNMFIMDAKHYDEYCSWMFDILFKIEKELNLYDKTLAPNTKRARWAGFLGERLTAIYIQKQIDEGKKIGEFPAVILTPNPNQKWSQCNTYDTELYKTQQITPLIIPNNLKPNAPIISVCITAYNVDKFIEKCISSVLQQTLQNIEIIIVNDGSKDKTLEIIQRLSKKDSRILLINQNNQGTGNARNTALKKASGKYIHLMDGDDFMDETFLEKMVKNAEKFQSDMVISTHRGVDENTLNVLYTSTLPPSLLQAGFNVKNNLDLLLIPCHLWDKIYKKELISDIKFTPEGGEDIYFWYRTILKAQNVSIHRSCEYNYRINTKSVQTNPKYALGVFINLQRAQELIEKTKNIRIIEMFNLFKEVLVAHMMYRARITLQKNKQFRQDFYSQIKNVLCTNELSDEIQQKKAWYPTNFEFIEEIKKSQSLKEFEKIISLQSQTQLLLKYIKYSVKKLFTNQKKNKKYEQKIEEIRSLFVYPIKLKFGKVTWLRISQKNNKTKISVLGVSLMSCKKTDYKMNYHLFGIPLFSKTKTKTRLLGLTIKDNTDIFLQKQFEKLLHDISQLNSCFEKFER